MAGSSIMTCWKSCRGSASVVMWSASTLVEVAPAYDQTESTQILAAQLLLNFIGFIFHNRK